jgi:hypothetical protein
MWQVQGRGEQASGQRLVDKEENRGRWRVLMILSKQPWSWRR